jgi:hypothetical protein
MAYEQKDNSGAMFVNDRKEKDSHPDRRGDAMIDGKMYWVSGWIKEGKKGKWMSLSFTPKEDKPQRSTPDSRAARPRADLDDSPF